MPARASLDERVKWHLAHTKQCGCRPIPRTLAAELERRGYNVGHAMKDDPPRKRLAGFIARHTPAVAALAKAALARMRKRLPGAIELVYDNYNALAIGFGPTERASDAVFSIALFPRWVSLFFLRGVGLPDPEKLLKGGGNVVRHIVLASASDLDKPAVRTLMAHALERSPKPIDAKRRGRIVIKSVSAKQRPRRPASRD